MSGEHYEPWQYIHDELFDCHGDSICVVPEPGDAERIKACVNALDGVTTEQLTPGCVAKLFNAISLIAGSQTINENAKDYLTAGCMQQIAEAALAAMKGV